MDPVGYRPDAQGNPVPIYNAATPGIGGAISDFVKALAMAFGPKSITQRAGKLKQQEETAQSASPQTTDLGNQF